MPRGSPNKTSARSLVERLNGRSSIDVYEAAKKIWERDDPRTLRSVIRTLKRGKRALNRAAAAYALHLMHGRTAIAALETTVQNRQEHPKVRGQCEGTGYEIGSTAAEESHCGRDAATSQRTAKIENELQRARRKVRGVGTYVSGRSLIHIGFPDCFGKPFLRLGKKFVSLRDENNFAPSTTNQMVPPYKQCRINALDGVVSTG
jgi:hypothetical protein